MYDVPLIYVQVNLLDYRRWTNGAVAWWKLNRFGMYVRKHTSARRVWTRHVVSRGVSIPNRSVGTVLRLETDAWSTVKRGKQQMSTPPRPPVLMRLADHLTALRSWCTRCPPGRGKSDMLRPGIVGMRGSMAIRIGPHAQTDYTPRPFMRRSHRVRECDRLYTEERDVWEEEEEEEEEEERKTGEKCDTEKVWGNR